MATYPVLKLKWLAGLFLLGIAVPACGGGDGECCDPLPSTTISKASADNGDAQTGTVGQPLAQPLRVVVTQDGQPLAGSTVAWSTTAAGASLEPASTATDNDGAATITWTLGTAAGPQTAQASLSGASGSPVTFNATANAGAAASLSKFGGDQQEAPINTALPTPVVAKVSDQFGNGVAGVPVSWSASGAAVSAASVPTDAAGASAVTVTLGGEEGPITITAEASALSGSPQIFSATALPPAPATANVQVVNSSFVPAALTVPAGTTVVWTWGPGSTSHNVTPVSSEPPGSGPLSSAPDTYQYTFNTPGTYIYYCQAHGTPIGGMRGTITVQ
jgi:plastocyanin